MQWDKIMMFCVTRENCSVRPRPPASIGLAGRRMREKILLFSQSYSKKVERK